MSEPLPCPDCGAMQMVGVVEDYPLDDGVVVRRLHHFKCGDCGARFLDDEAMHRIQLERKKRSVTQSR